MTGKFWVYERVIRPAYYGIYEVDPGRIEMYHLVDDRFQPLPANERGRYPIEGLGVELGIWQGDLPGPRPPLDALVGRRGQAPPDRPRAGRDRGRPGRRDAEADRAEREAAARPTSSPRSSGPWGSSRRPEASRSAQAIDRVTGSVPARPGAARRPARPDDDARRVGQAVQHGWRPG